MNLGMKAGALGNLRPGAESALIDCDGARRLCWAQVGVSGWLERIHHLDRSLLPSVSVQIGQGTSLLP